MSNNSLHKTHRGGTRPFSSSKAKSSQIAEHRNARKSGQPLRQTTLASSISCSGTGLHSGARISMVLHPAPADSGIVFKRVDLAGGGVEIPANWQNIIDSRLCTVLGTPQGVSIGTVEHLMSALHGMGVDNALVEVQGAEIPIMDGSAAAFVFLIECAGITPLDAPRKAIRLLREFSHQTDHSKVSLSPAPCMEIAFEIDFAASAVGRQAVAFCASRDSYKAHLGRARTFGFLADVTALREAGLARGGSLDNALVVDGDRVLNDDGLRFDDEFVRHKALDALGDLALAGHPILGRFTGYRSSHADTASLLRRIFAVQDGWELVDMTTDMVAADPVSGPVSALSAAGSERAARAAAG